MDDYKKQILKEVLEHPAFRDAAKNLDEKQRAQVETHLTKFIDSFSGNLFSVFSKLAEVAPKKTDGNSKE